MIHGQPHDSKRGGDRAVQAHRAIIAAMIASAYLRVFQPLDALPERDRAAWERSIVRGDHELPIRPVYRERGAQGRLGLLTSEEDRADVRMVNGRTYVCPWRTPVRILAALLSLREIVPQEMADVLVPEPEARRAARELARIRRRDPAAVPAMLESHWHVPVRWFVLFSGEERRIAEGPDGGWRVSYWTPLPAAHDRVRRAVRVFQEGRLDQVVDVVRDLEEWLRCFHREAAVELDYGTIADLFGWNELDDDRSAEEVQSSIDALEAGHPERAEELYRQVAGRWAEARIRERFN